jgi:hypothetical protein
MSHRGERVLPGGFKRHSQKAGDVMLRWLSSVARCSAALLAAAVLATPGSFAIAQPLHAANAHGLRDLGGISELRTLFDLESDKVRILMLLSPT